MSKVMLMIILMFVLLNVGFLFIYLNKPEDTEIVSNETQESLQEVEEEIAESLNLSLVYESRCINSTKKHVRYLENITNLTLIKAKTFDNEKNARYYLTHSWPSVFYSIDGMDKDIIDNTVVSVFNIKAIGERNFTLPILCDIDGNIGNYSSCLLDNIPNIPSACYNLTINLTECMIEWREHDILDDIEFWIEPPGAALIIGATGIENKTGQVFNFTILSSRKRLEYFGMSVIQRTFIPIIVDDELFSLNKMTPKGEGGSIVREINITNRTNVEFYATIWFKKKCYEKYVIY